MTAEPVLDAITRMPASHGETLMRLDGTCAKPHRLQFSDSGGPTAEGNPGGNPGAPCQLSGLPPSFFARDPADPAHHQAG